MASFAPVAEFASSTSQGRRLAAEWALLQRLTARNPGRLLLPRAQDCAFTFELRATPTLDAASRELFTTHQVGIDFPRFFPAVPLELTLATPAFHPNIHPMTGFVCLWDRHHAGNTTEQAVHKLVAILGWQLQATDERHLLQPAAAALDPRETEALRAQLRAPALEGVEPPTPMAPVVRRRRLL